MENLKETLDEVFRILSDIRVAQEFKEDLINNKNKITMVNFGNGEGIFTTLDAKVQGQMDEKIIALVKQLKIKVSEIK